jgi:hypothetical protein
MCKIYIIYFYRKDNIVEIQENSSLNNNNNIINNGNNIIDNEINNQYSNPNLPQQQILEKFENDTNNQINNNNIENNNDTNIINNEDNL